MTETERPSVSLLDLHVSSFRFSLLGVASALGVLLFQMMNVAQVGEVGHTLFGTTSHGIWVSTPEILSLVVVCYVLGELAAAGIILSALALSFAVAEPVFIAATIGSKVMAVIFVAIGRRLGAGLLVSMLLALEVDVVAFALWAGLPSIIATSMAVRLALWVGVVVTVEACVVTEEKLWRT